MAFLLKSLGLDNEEVLSRFYKSSELSIQEDKKINIVYDFNDLKGELNFDLINAEVIMKLLLKKVIGLLIDTIESFEEKKVTNILVPDDAIFGKYLA